MRILNLPLRVTSLFEFVSVQAPGEIGYRVRVIPFQYVVLAGLAVGVAVIHILRRSSSGSVGDAKAGARNLLIVGGVFLVGSALAIAWTAHRGWAFDNVMYMLLPPAIGAYLIFKGLESWWHASGAATKNPSRGSPGKSVGYPRAK